MMNPQPAVSILIVSYNTRELTLDCIRSIIGQTRSHDYEIIVVDNRSKDGSAEAIRTEFPQVKLHALEHNLGFAGGNNAAAAVARGKRLLLLNPDTVVLDRAIDRLLEFADRKPDALVWGGRAVFPDGSINASCWNDMTLWSSVCRAVGLTWLFPGSRCFNPETIHRWDSLKHEREVDIVSGCFLLIERSLWDRIGGFDPTFFMYGDEVDLCIRARKHGARPRITPTAEIIHYGGGSEPSNEEKLVKLFKGRITVMKVHWQPPAVIAGRLALLSTAAIRAIGSLLLHPPMPRATNAATRPNVWPAVFRRRKEWSAGWDKKNMSH